jgi:hypothetical protein
MELLKKQYECTYVKYFIISERWCGILRNNYESFLCLRTKRAPQYPDINKSSEPGGEGGGRGEREGKEKGYRKRKGESS